VLTEGRRTHVLVLSWHPEHGAITAGGFRRSVAVLRRFVGKGRLTIVDATPSIFREVHLNEEDRVVEYRLPRLKRIARSSRSVARAVQWGLACMHLVQLGLKHDRRARSVIYVPTSELLPCALAGVVLKLLTRSRLVMCNQNVEGIFARRVVLLLHNRADAVTTVSHALERALRTAGVTTPIVVTGAAVPEIAPTLASEIAPLKKWDGVFVGRQTPEKGIFDLLDVWERVLNTRPDATLVVIGASTPEIDRELDARLSQPPFLSARVTREGVVTDDEKFRHLRASRVLLAPSRVEGWGFVPREALAVGVPVVCYDLPAYKESLPANPLVTKVPIRDVRAFASAVLDRLATGTDAEVAIPADTSTDWDNVASREWQAVDIDSISPVSESPIRRARRLAGELTQVRAVVRNWAEVSATASLYKLLPLPARDVKVTMRSGATLRAPVARNVGGLYPVLEVFAYHIYSCDWELEESATVVDIGAHVGSFLIWLSSRHGPVRGAAYEPDPAAFRYLRTNLDANGLANVTTHPEAVADRSGEGMLVRPVAAGGTGSLYARDADQRGESIQTSIVAFDDAVARIEGDISLVKLDCEGAEYDIVLGSDSASWQRIKRIILVHHPFDGAEPEQLVERLAEQGFRCVKRTTGAMEGTLWLTRT
jgi:FkbM family methyltransferase